MGFFSGVFDWFVGIGIGVLTFVGVPVAATTRSAEAMTSSGRDDSGCCGLRMSVLASQPFCCAALSRARAARKLVATP